MLNVIIFSAVVLAAPQTPIYRTPAGELVSMLLFTALIGVMVVIRRSVAPRPVPRILGSTSVKPQPQMDAKGVLKNAVSHAVGGERR